MGNKIYVGNLAFSVTDQVLSEVFSKYGTVESARVLNDRGTGRSKGFGFVEMSTPEEAESAIRSLNGSECEGRAMNVNEARPQAPRSDGNFGENRRNRY